MRTLFLCAVATALWGVPAFAGQNDATNEILALERKALDGWVTGNPDPMLAIMDPDITYFHVVSGSRVDGVQAVKALFESYRGRPLFDSYEISAPKVQLAGDTAILSYILVCHNGPTPNRWSATHVYQHKKEGWRVLHSHWSATGGQ